MQTSHKKIAHYHLPGLFEFDELYKIFLPIYREHPEYFYDWCDIASIYGAPADCLWGGGRTGFGSADTNDVLDLMNEYNIKPEEVACYYYNLGRKETRDRVKNVYNLAMSLV